jgi:signal transduction histidine kinase
MPILQLTSQQVDYLLANCPLENESSPNTLDTDSFRVLHADGLRLMTPVSFEPGDVICREGDTGDAMYLIRAGRAAIVRGSFDAPIILSCRGAGEYIGEMALLEDLPRSASVVALDEMQVLRLTRDDFKRMMVNSPKMDIGLMQRLSARLRAADDMITTDTHTRRDLSSHVSQLEAANQQLLELQRLREQMTDLILHDLHNPLHIISGAAGMLQMVLPDEILQANRDLFNLVIANCDRMQRLTESLLDISRMEAGELSLTMEPTSLIELLQAAASRITLVLQMRDIAYELLIPADLPIVMIDPDMIDRVVVNLLDNAIKFTPSGGRIRVSAEACGAQVSISVSDSGYGIPPDQRERIFDRFARVSDDKPRVRGFGLGLTFCKLAVEGHGGRIWVEDGENSVGSRFVFTLPIVPPRSPERAEDGVSEELFP